MISNKTKLALVAPGAAAGMLLAAMPTFAQYTPDTGVAAMVTEAGTALKGETVAATGDLIGPALVAAAAVAVFFLGIKLVRRILR